MFNLDLTLLRDPKRFEKMCFRLARYEFTDAVPLADSWDGGRDIVNWLRTELDRRGLTGHVWARDELLARLEKHPDVIDTFFYAIFSELEVYFRTERLELFKLTLDSACQWKQPDRKVLYFSTRDFLTSADLVLDVIVRNTGTIATAITGIAAEVFDRHHKFHGLPGDGLLFPQITYAVSIRRGQAGVYFTECEPPLVVKAGDLERFKIRVTDTGFAWNGCLRLSLIAGQTERLCLPAIRIFT